MTTVVQGINVKVEVQSGALAATKTISAITKANPAVASSTAHGYANGDVVVLAMGSDGMIQLDGQAVRVSGVVTDSFTLESIDSTSFGTFTTGTAAKVTTFATYGQARTFSAPQATPPKNDVTTLIDSEQQIAFGLVQAVDGSIDCLFNPGGATEALIVAATNSQTPLAIRITYAGGQHTVMNAYVSGGSGFTMPQGQPGTTTTSFTPKKKMLHYST